MSLPKPIGDRILVQQDTQKMDSTILLTSDESKESLKRPKGIVLGVGNGSAIQALDIQVDDVVFFNEFAGERIVFDKEEYLLLRPDEILAKEDF